jgi:hypothetical protein
MSSKKTNFVQLRLLIDPSWIPELDSLARSKHLTRLGLIRLYLRAKIDDDLSQLSVFFQEREQRRRTQTKLKGYLDEMDY